MSLRAELVTAACTVGCALGIGFVMQSGEVAEMRYGTGAVSAIPSMPVVGEPALPLRVRDMTLHRDGETLDVKQITLTSAEIKTANVFSNPMTASASSQEVADLFNPDIGRDPACALSAAAEPTSAAMVSLAVSAPCYSGEVVVITQGPLKFSETLDGQGGLSLNVPALSENARISIEFEDGERISAFTKVDSVPLYDRVILQWAGVSDLQIHAREFGGDYGGDGHVWAGAPRDASAVNEGSGGFLISLGHPSLAEGTRSEVYTFPALLNDAANGISLTLEAEVTEANCGSEVQARTFEFSGGKVVASQTLSLAIPGCSAVGNFLVLNNLLQDLTIASK